jgi:oligopeptidase B
MVNLRYALAMAGSMLLAGSAGAQQAPVAARRPHAVVAPFGATRNDPYYWLRDDTRKNPEMLAYLAAENAYADAMMAPLKPLQTAVLAEIKGRIKQDDASVPYRKRGYLYYTRFEPGGDYPIVARRARSMAAPEQIMLDEPRMAAGHGYFQIGDPAVSTNNRLLAYAEDVIGRRQYVLKIKDLASGKLLPDSIANVEPGSIWADDNRTIFYIEKDPVTLLSKRVKAHVLGTPASADRLVYAEKEDSYYLALKRTADDRYLCITLVSTISTEERCASAAAPVAFKPIAPRARDLRYDVDHIGDHWVIHTNLGAPNYKLASVRDADVGRGPAAWRTLVPTNANVFIQDFHPFDSFLAIEERAGGNKRLRLLTNAGRSVIVPAAEPAYTMALDINAETATPWVRYSYGSLTTPETIIEVNASTGVRRVLKVEQVPGYNASRYVTERVWVIARDGTRVPVSIAHSRAFRRDGTAPLFQYGYGSYGVSSDPEFQLVVPSLLDRGFVYAVAHVRGGQEMGRRWYDDGHLMHKTNSFTDFIDVTRALVAQHYAAPGRVVAEGASAGGLLMGAVANMAPRDYAAIIALVPFVDAVTTMLDASIPLTTNEYNEWGNPANKAAYDYMLAYSPYDNVAAKAYPAMYVGTGLWDSQVQYYEPTKYVAKLRATKTDNHPLVFRVNMEGGHGGKSGRFRRYEQQAESAAFAMSQVGVTH